MRRLEYDILECLEQGEHVVSATILTHAGSTPRTSGAKMLIHRDGTIRGTVGGGLVEAEVMRTGLELIGASASVVCSYDLGIGNRADTMDMLCGGRLDVLLEPIAPTEETIQLYRSLADILTRGRKGLVITALPGEGGAPGYPGKYLTDEKGTPIGTGPLPKDLSAPVLAAAVGRRNPMVYPPQTPGYVMEPLAVPGTVYIFGAGHVSQAVAALTGMVGFRTVVRDDREEFANRKRFPQVAIVETVSSFEKATSGLAIDPDSYLVIVTRGHRHDGTVLAQALAGAAGYIGMIGSRRKRDAIYRDMRSRGFSANDLKRVHSPIGLSIGAESPEEIAVSIVAQLIAVRAGRDE